MSSRKAYSKKRLERLAKNAFDLIAEGKFFHSVNRIPMGFEHCVEYKYLILLAKFIAVTSDKSKNALPCHFELWELQRQKKCKKYMRPVLLYCSLVCLAQMPLTYVVQEELAVVRRKFRIMERLLPKELRKEARKHFRIAS